MPCCRTLAYSAVLVTALVGCSQPGGGAFCEQAEFFRSRSVRDVDQHAEDRAPGAYLDALVSLRDLASGTLKADLDVLVAYEQNYDPLSGDQHHSINVDRAGQRVGSAIEQRCALQLPNVRGDS